MDVEYFAFEQGHSDQASNCLDLSVESNCISLRCNRISCR